ncbi:phospholipase, partial [Streptomyces scopuliridis]
MSTPISTPKNTRIGTRRGFLAGAVAVSAAGLLGAAPAGAAPRRALATYDWMRGFADSTPVQRLTIPGTH